MDYQKEALRKHREWAGKIEIKTRAPLDTAEALALAYTPGVAAPCLEIEKNPDLSFTYTRRWNTVAVITNGTAILGLGDIGPVAGMPVMEGKAALFKLSVTLMLYRCVSTAKTWMSLFILLPLCREVSAALIWRISRRRNAFILRKS